MKNYFTLVFLLLCFSVINAQEIPNPDFETWEDMGTYEDPEFWNTPNPFTSLAGAITVSKSEDAYSGTYSARLETVDILGGLYQAPGLLTYADFFVDFQTGEYSFGGGIPKSETVTHVHGKYKYSGVAGDSASIIAVSFRHPEGEDNDTTAIGFSFLPDASEWTEFTVNMVQLSEETPDTFNIMILSSGSFELVAGSVLYVDDLSISIITDIAERENEFSISTYPNPVIDRVTFEANKTANDRMLDIYDLTGRRISSQNFNSEKIIVDLSQFPAGMYTYRVSSENNLLKSGQLVKR